MSREKSYSTKYINYSNCFSTQGSIAPIFVKIIFGFLYVCSVREKISLEKSEHFPKIIPS